MTGGGVGRIRVNPAKRKLSESRGVNLPDIRIIQPVFVWVYRLTYSIFHIQNTPKSSIKSVSTSRNQPTDAAAAVHPTTTTSIEPATPITGSPVGYVMR